MMSDSNPHLEPEVTPLPPEDGSFEPGAAAGMEADSATGRGLIDSLLDPKTLQTLMLGGGGLTVLGLVIWLVAIGLFDNPIWAAAGLTTVNLGLLGAGVGVAGCTRYRTAGRAVAMLASIVLPLNLWFYDAQGLVTLDDGGNLWLPALVCCMIYAGVARYLKDSLFVYTFVGGIALSGMLFLADASVGHFWEVLAPSTLFVVLGTLAIHAERLFPKVTEEENVAFTRDDFGLAFFRAGHSLLAVGLGLLLSGRVVGWFYESYFEQFDLFAMPDVAAVGKVQLAALLLVIVGAYNYAYSRLVVGSGRHYSISSLLTLCWAVVIGFDLLNITLTANLVIGLLAGFALVCRFLESQSSEKLQEETIEEGAGSKLLREVAPVAGIVAHGMSGLSLLICLFQTSQFYEGAQVVGWGYFISAGLLIASFVAGLYSKTHEGDKKWSVRGKYLCTGSLVAFATTLLVGCEFFNLHLEATAFLVMLMAPISALMLATLSSKFHFKKDLLWSATCVSSLIVVTSPWLLFQEDSLTAASFYGIASALFAGFAMHNGRTLTSSFSAVLGCLSVWQFIKYFELGVPLPLFVISLVGLGVVVFARLNSKDRFARTGQLLVVLGNAAGGLLVANRLAADEASFQLLGMLVGQVVVAFVASWFLSKGEAGEKKSPVLIVMGVVGLLLAGLTLNNLSDLSGWQRFELLTTTAGVFMLVAGHVGWYREEGKPNGMVDLNLWVGSLLATLPCTLSLLAMRLWGDSSNIDGLVHEAGALLIGLSLLGTGILCRLRSTTLMGGATVTLYLVSLVALIHVPNQLQNVAVYLMVGGGLFFGTAVMLSVYRDRLLAVTEQVREREGVFSVLRWR